jgi:hypothetical protein
MLIPAGRRRWVCAGPHGKAYAAGILQAAGSKKPSFLKKLGFYSAESARF